ncbi:kinesin [Verticillium alfalfae VaMs.102]|uniref:Kinesin n=1 Tax=Verticillium alfalfae (strain VaMs.102 / ATCC MYA-4576 / FGSC 10136) TaxID=526221 RepID=C9SN73_VERA1|nr:kinesin [Verticillium alfalfae VaMs.102]EEY20238.1 kinesin [Verticillium alfalfae VaMs.102]
MDSAPTKPPSNLFQVYLRLRPSPAGSTASDKFLSVEREDTSEHPTHIILNPPNDRKRSTEKFAFTQVFEEDATQLDVFQCTGVAPLIEGVLAPHGGVGTDALLATLGVTGSGKSHTILGSRSQRGLTQLSLDVIFRAIGFNMLDNASSPDLDSSLQLSDPSDATIVSAPTFLETVYADFAGPARAGSRAPTPMLVGPPPAFFDAPPAFLAASPAFFDTPRPHTAPRRVPSGPGPPTVRVVPPTPNAQGRVLPTSSSTPMHLPPSPQKHLPTQHTLSPQKHYMTWTTASKTKKNLTKTPIKGEYPPQQTPRRHLQRPSAVPQIPDVSTVHVSSDPNAEYAVVLSMYEVYNDKIYDLLTPPIRSNATKEYRRRPLLFKSTEQSADRKVVAGLKKIVCKSLREAILVLEAGLHERQVAGTGSNSVSSRSHGFFCVEVRKRTRGQRSSTWTGSTLTVVDLAGSGACARCKDPRQHARRRQARSTRVSCTWGSASRRRAGWGTQASNSFSTTSSSYTAPVVPRRNAQRGVMIVTADAHGDVNATSQILRYSALAREVTIPRIPSITSTILADMPTANAHSETLLSVNSASSQRSYFSQPSGSHRNISPSSPTDGDRFIMEHAALEIARMQEEINSLHQELDVERDARVAAEAHLLSMEDRMLELEQTIREDCAAEYESRYDLEVARWKATMQAQQERGEEHWDRKMELFERGLGPHDDDDEEGGEDKENVLVENLAQENERLRREMGVLKRELAGRSPTRRQPLHERDDFGSRKPDGGTGSLGRKMEQLRVSNASVSSVASGGSPKKIRRLPTKRWEDADDLA